MRYVELDPVHHRLTLRTQPQPYLARHAPQLTCQQQPQHRPPGHKLVARHAHAKPARLFHLIRLQHRPAVMRDRSRIQAPYLRLTGAQPRRPSEFT